LTLPLLEGLRLPELIPQEGYMVEFQVNGMYCMFCAYRLKAAIRAIDPCLKVGIDLKTSRVNVERPMDVATVERASKNVGQLVGVRESDGKSGASLVAQIRLDLPIVGRSTL
jgi:copper chaperone CopZ